MDTKKVMQLSNFMKSLDDNRFSMDTFVGGHYYIDKIQQRNCVVNIDEFCELTQTNVCNTTACIAGWAICLDNGGTAILSDGRNSRVASMNCLKGAIALGLSFHEGEKLFYPLDDNSLCQAVLFGVGNFKWNAELIQLQEEFVSYDDMNDMNSFDAHILLKNLALGNLNFDYDLKELAERQEDDIKLRGDWYDEENEYDDSDVYAELEEEEEI